MISSAQPGRSPILAAVEKAERRRLLTLAVEYSAFACMALGAALIFLLLLGTDILAWPWMMAIVVAGVAITALGVRRRLLSRYSVAQLLDRRLGLGDSLSTAWFLLSENRASARGSFADAQIARAESHVGGLASAAAFPFVWRKTWAIAAGLCVAAFALFAARYFVTSSLSLKHAWLPMPAALVNHRLADRTNNATEARPSGLKGNQRRATARPHSSDKRSTESPAQVKTAAAKSAGSPHPNESSKPDGDKPSANAANAQQSAALKSNSAQDNAPQLRPSSANRNDNPGRPNGDRQEKGAGIENARNSTSLGEKMKDALSGLMDKMRPSGSSPGRDANNQQPSSTAKDAAKRAEGNSQNAQSASNTPNSGDEQKQGREAGAQGKAMAQASEQMSATAKGASDESAGHKGNDAHSGIGRQDGQKALTEAEQLKAMGKLEQIIGKRSASLTGDVTVETQSGHQQLQTQYTGRLGHHADLGGEIDRNEVPVALQNYVREYMDQVRKQANGGNQ